MKVKEKISFEDFEGKRFRIKTLEPIQHKTAVVSHYLHNIKNGVSKYYKADAENYFNELLQYKFPKEELNIVAEPALQQLLFEVENVPFPTPENYKFKFIDLFAGIGGFRLAMQNLGGKCVFTSEWDAEAQRTYRANFGEVPFGDITKEETKRYIPDDFDVLGISLSYRTFRSNSSANSLPNEFLLQPLEHKAA